MFGENLTLKNLDESDVFFGNQYRLGETILEVYEIREPCWKIQTKYGIKDLVKECLLVENRLLFSSVTRRICRSR